MNFERRGILGLLGGGLAALANAGRAGATPTPEAVTQAIRPPVSGGIVAPSPVPGGIVAPATVRGGMITTEEIVVGSITAKRLHVNEKQSY